MSVFTQDVSSWVEIDADNFTLNFHVTEIEVTRTAQKDTGKATIKGVINNPDLDDYSDQLSATQEQQISVHTATETSETPWDANLTSEQVIFIGDIINLKQNKDGVFIFEAFDVSRVLKNKRIQLASESNNTAIDVITDILSNELSRFDSVANSYEEASLTTPYVETVDIQPSPWNFGTDEKGVPLIDAMYDLIKSYGGVLWVDRKGILRIEKASPERWKNIEVPFITDISAGEDNRNADRVIFEGTGTSSELGQAGAYVHSQTSYSSASGIGNIFSGNDLPEKNLSDENVTTQEEADQRSFNEAVSTEQNRDMGEITVIGNGSIELFDRVTVPELNI